ncbi:MAG: alpha/beta fold hydrolase [Vicinamibacteraceae bacterium]|nr:alpha/beta fold hydrolase [Vicinamibacteraceae bacterium]
MLFATWYMGRSDAAAALVGPGRLLDPERHFVVVVDALANGVSTSPSTSPGQRADSFPDLTIGDMVAAQHRLITAHLGLTSLHAVIGVSMGGMQAFEWMVAHPGFAKRIVSVHGTPRVSTYDRLIWREELVLLDAAQALGEWGPRNPAVTALALLAIRYTSTPSRLNRTVEAAAVPELTKFWVDLMIGTNPHDRRTQLLAMDRFDVARRHDGKLERAAATVRARVLIVVAMTDQAVSPEPSLAFAALLGQKPLVLDGTCGHLASHCEGERLAAAAAEFLR